MSSFVAELLHILEANVYNNMPLVLLVFFYYTPSGIFVGIYMFNILVLKTTDLPYLKLFSLLRTAL
jgi:hypothetical protein